MLDAGSNVKNLNRLSRQETADFIGCSLSKLYSMEKAGLMKGTYYEIGYGLRNRRFYITSKLEDWLDKGGEPAAWERKLGIIS